MKKLKISSLPEHYDSIDTLPVLQWEKIHKKFDMIYLLVKPKKLSEKQEKELKKVWEKIFYEFIHVFGFSEKFNDIINQKLKLARLKNMRVITDDDSIQNLIRIEEIKLESMQKINNKGGDMYKTKAIIEKYYGIHIPLAQCSVREFYSYLKEMKVNGNK